MSTNKTKPVRKHPCLLLQPARLITVGICLLLFVHNIAPSQERSFRAQNRRPSEATVKPVQKLSSPKSKPSPATDSRFFVDRSPLSAWKSIKEFGAAPEAKKLELPFGKPPQQLVAAAPTPKPPVRTKIGTLSKIVMSKESLFSRKPKNSQRPVIEENVDGSVKLASQTTTTSAFTPAATTTSSDQQRTPVPLNSIPFEQTRHSKKVSSPCTDLSQISHVQQSEPTLPETDGIVVIPDEPLPAVDLPTVTMDENAGTLQLPLDGSNSGGEIHFDSEGELLTLSFRDAPLREVLGVLAESQGLNLICSAGTDTKITGNFHSITFDDAMNTVLSVSGHTWTRRNNVIMVTPLGNEAKLGPEVQGREVRVFTLNYLAAADVQKASTALLSPSGTMVITEADPTDSNKTREQVLVEDMPAYLDRIAQLIAQIDIQPRQVLIEAHILQVDLKDDTANGVDFAKLGSIAGTKILVGSPGFNGKVTALETFASPSYNIGIFNAGSFSGLIEALQKTTDAKTLASPKVLALNGQEAHVQIGRRLGYYVTTTTQTSTLQSVQFLDTGVVLRVTPRITDDNQIMMTVKPEVSDGAVDALGLPSSTTTEVETNIMLPDGKGMVIGGLIKESDITRQQKVPVLGSLWGIGKLFRRTSVVRERSEIIIALVPRIVGGPEFDACSEEVDVQRTTTPLLHGPLNRYPRPWEPSLPDAVENPRRLDKKRTKELWRHPSEGPPQHLDYYFPTAENHSQSSMVFESIPMYQSEMHSPPQNYPQPVYPVESYESDGPAVPVPASTPIQ